MNDPNDQFEYLYLVDKAPELVAEMNRYGERGWEGFAMSDSPFANTPMCWMKRKKCPTNKTTDAAPTAAAR